MQMIFKPRAKIFPCFYSGGECVPSGGRRVGISEDGMSGKKPNIAAEVVAGAAVGAVNGLLGGGGGMLCVPLLTGVAHERVKIAHATTVLLILPVCIASASVYWASGRFDFVAEVPVIVGVVAGGIIGSVLLKVLRGRAIAVIFALLMIAAGLRSVMAV